MKNAFTFIPIGVQCGFMTEKSFEGSGFTADQMVCIATEGAEPFISLVELIQDDPNAQPDLGLLAQLLQVFDTCDISLEQFMQ